jgi:hypothetical protein
MPKSIRGLLLILVLLAFPFVASASAIEIELGSTVEGELTQAAPSVEYSFEGTENQLVTISLVSDDFDCYLVLLDESGNELVADDDSGGSFDSLISNFALPEDGSYTIVAQSVEASRGEVATGEYTLSIEEAANSGIAYGDTIEGNLTADETSVFYTFSGSEGDTVLISMTSASDDSYLNLYQGAVEDVTTTSPITYNDDGGGNRNALIGPYVLPADDIYTIEATSFDRVSTFSYVLTLTNPTPVVIEYGSEQEVVLTADENIAFYNFEGEAGDILDITAEGASDIGTSGVSLVLNAPDGFQINYVDSSFGDDAAMDDFILPSSGTYTLVIRPLESGSEGKLTLLIKRAVLASLDEAPQTLAFDSSTTRRSVTFSGNSGESVTLALAEADGMSIAPIITVTQNGNTIAYVNANTLSDVSFEFEVPSTGDVLVQIDEYSYDTRNVMVELTREEE